MAPRVERGVERTGAPATSPGNLNAADARTEGAGELRYASTRGRTVLLATVLGSGIAFLDATVVNVALPSIGEDLDASLSGLQWTVNAYALTLAGLLLIGGSLGDHFGRRKVFSIGVAWFAVASLLCAIAPTIETLIAARAIQGVGAALLTPGSLALLEASFRKGDRAAAIGAWSGLAGITTAFGPFLGGWLVEAASWRLIFLINLPSRPSCSGRPAPSPSRAPRRRRAPVSTGPGRRSRRWGSPGVTYALTEGPGSGWTVAGRGRPRPLGGCAALIAFIARRDARSRTRWCRCRCSGRATFSAANALTFVVYGALGAAFFLAADPAPGVAGFTPIQAGSALIPMSLVLLLLSKSAGRLRRASGRACRWGSARSSPPSGCCCCCASARAPTT